MSESTLNLLKDWGSSGVAITVMILFFAQLKAMGASRDIERKEFLKAVKGFVNANIAVMLLAQTMVDNCQGSVAEGLRVSQREIVDAMMGDVDETKDHDKRHKPKQ